MKLTVEVHLWISTVKATQIKPHSSFLCNFSQAKYFHGSQTPPSPRTSNVNLSSKWHQAWTLALLLFNSICFETEKLPNGDVIHKRPDSRLVFVRGTTCVASWVQRLLQISLRGPGSTKTNAFRPELMVYCWWHHQLGVCDGPLQISSMGANMFERVTWKKMKEGDLLQCVDFGMDYASVALLRSFCG